MARITFGQITLEDPNKSLQELVQVYKGLFVNEEFALPLISNVSDVEDIIEEDYETEDDTVLDEKKDPEQGPNQV